MIKLYTGCLVLLIGNLIVGQAVKTLKIVKHVISIKQWSYALRENNKLVNNLS